MVKWPHPVIRFWLLPPTALLKRKLPRRAALFSRPTPIGFASNISRPGQRRIMFSAKGRPARNRRTSPRFQVSARPLPPAERALRLRPTPPPRIHDLSWLSPRLRNRRPRLQDKPRTPARASRPSPLRRPRPNPSKALLPRHRIHDVHCMTEYTEQILTTVPRKQGAERMRLVWLVIVPL